MKILIVGLGLIGGSLAKAFKKFTDYYITGSDIDKTVEEKAIENGSDDNITAMVLRVVNSTNSSTIKRGLMHQLGLFQFLLGLGVSAVVFAIIIVIILINLN